VDERYELKPVFLLGNNVSREVSNAIEDVVQNKLPDLLTPYAGSQAITQFASEGIEGYKQDISVYSSSLNAQALSIPKVLIVYSDVSLIPFAASLSNTLNEYQIAFNIIPSDDPMANYREGSGDLFLVQHDYNDEPSLIYFLKQLSGDEFLSSEIERIEKISSPFERQKQLSKLSLELGTKYGYPLFENVSMDAVCNM
jgi:hypothetical protein